MDSKGWTIEFPSYLAPDKKPKKTDREALGSLKLWFGTYKGTMIKDTPPSYQRRAASQPEMGPDLAYVAAYAALAPPPDDLGGKPPPPQRSEQSQPSSSHSSAPRAKPSPQRQRPTSKSAPKRGHSSFRIATESEAEEIKTEESLEFPAEEGMDLSSSACTDSDQGL